MGWVERGERGGLKALLRTMGGWMGWVSGWVGGWVRYVRSFPASANRSDFLFLPEFFFICRDLGATSKRRICRGGGWVGGWVSGWVGESRKLGEWVDEHFVEMGGYVGGWVGG